MAEDRAPEQAGGESAELKRKLVKRMAFAGVMIAVLLGALAVVDRLSEPEAPPAPPAKVAVPTPQKEIAKPLTPPAEPATEAPAPGAPAAPATPSADEVPPKPEVAAEPSKAVAGGGPAPRVLSAKPITPAPAAAAKPAVPEGSASPGTPLAPAASVPAQEAPAQEAPAMAAAKPTLPRLLRGYVLQAGVFSNVKLAEELHAKLTLNGIPSTLEARVQVGPFRSRQEAEAARAKLKGLGIESLLVPPRAASGHKP